jgi:hypothetical protein
MTRRFALLLVGTAMAALVIAVTGAAVAQSAASVIRCEPSPPKACKGTQAKDTITGSARSDNTLPLAAPTLWTVSGAPIWCKGAKARTFREREGV